MEEKKYRHRIHELFSEEVLQKIWEIQRDPNISNNNKKVRQILFLLKDLGFTEIGPGTNRLTVRNKDYVFKIALDNYGIRDNWTEFDYSQELQPYVTKTYECNGIVAVAEYVNLMTQDEFIESKQNIRNILEILSKDYLFCDMGTISKNFTNFGYRNNDEIVILDYGYIYPLDRKIMYCTKCGNALKWNNDYSKLVCGRCGKLFDPIEVRDRMWKDEKDFVQHARDDGKKIKIKIC